MSVETQPIGTEQTIDDHATDSIKILAARALGQLTEGIDTLHLLQSAVDRSTFDRDTWGRVDRALKLATATAENISPLAVEETSASPAKPR
ncbi:MAG: hypothetical protein K8T25_08930 [Planctomycetia bacterium]|nr:hypothetical protein [Planctomycetia bacterium]